MRVVVSLEHHFDRTPDGVVWTQTQFPYRFWQRYLEVFDQVQVVARVRDVRKAAPDWQRADGRDRKSTRLNSSHVHGSRMPSSA